MSPPPALGATLPNLHELETMAKRFAPVALEADTAFLPLNERQALAKLIMAAKVNDGLFLRQTWAGNQAMLLDLLNDKSPLGRARLNMFLIDKGPWSRLDHNRITIPGAPPKPAGATFYPADSSKAEISTWLSSLTGDKKALAEGFFTTIRRDAKGKLIAVGYNLEYQAELSLAADYLRQAAALTNQPTLKSYLEKRAAAFLSNDYYDSDVAWMKLDSSIEPTIGPYEVYEDEWFNAKAAFEAFITIRDDQETQKLSNFGQHLQEIENNLPFDAEFRNPKIGAMAPIRVVSSIFCAGDANRGVQTAAFNLPNDERIGRELGTKRVMLKNVQAAKFNKVLLPIAKVALASSDLKRVSFDAFFTHILLHELMHGLGPSEVKSGGQKGSTIRAALQDTYSAIEEAKADISGLWALQFLIDKGHVDKSLETSIYTTFLASSFRSLRFGINEAHGKGIAIQLNYLLDAGAYEVSKSGLFSVNHTKIKPAVLALTSELLFIEALGNKSKADELLAKYVVIRPEVKRILDKLVKVPVDIVPSFPTAEKILAESQAAEQSK